MGVAASRHTFVWCIERSLSPSLSVFLRQEYPKFSSFLLPSFPFAKAGPTNLRCGRDFKETKRLFLSLWSQRTRERERRNRAPTLTEWKTGVGGKICSRDKHPSTRVRLVLLRKSFVKRTQKRVALFHSLTHSHYVYRYIETAIHKEVSTIIIRLEYFPRFPRIFTFDLTDYDLKLCPELDTP